MANYVWPPALPQVPQRGFSESVGANIIRTPTDQGPAKQRRRSLRPSTMGVSFLMTTAQVAILQDFLYDTLHGVKVFDFTHPRTGYTVNTRVVPGQDGELFKSTYAAPGYWTITLNFEILPTFTTLSPGSYNIPIGRLSQFSRTTTATYIDQDGVLQTAPANVARYQGGQLLVEGEATNICWPSNGGAGGWILLNGGTGVLPVVTNNFAAGPDGLTSAHRVVFDKGSGTTSADQSGVQTNFGGTVVGSPTAAAVWIRSNTASSYLMSLNFNGANSDAAGFPSLITVTPAWKRFEVRLSNVGDANRRVVLRLRGTYGTSNFADVLVFGFHQENAASVSSYIPTTTAAVTRAADLAIISAT